MYYQMISAIDSGGVLYVPMDGAEDKMREVISAEMAGDLIDGLDDMSLTDLPVGKKAEAVISDICKKNEAEDMLSLIKTLYHIKAVRAAEGKKFASVDERYLGVAEKLFYSEIAYALDMEFEEAREKITGILAQLPLAT